MKLTLKKDNSPKRHTREYKQVSKLRMLNILSIFLIITVFGVTVWFVYTNIYQTIGKVQTLLLVQADPHFEPINFKLYNDTTAAWDEKFVTKPLDIMHDPFYNISTVNTTSTTSTVDLVDNPNTTVEIQL